LQEKASSCFFFLKEAGKIGGMTGDVRGRGEKDEKNRDMAAHDKTRYKEGELPQLDIGIT
jgi:hypothetical protein